MKRMVVDTNFLRNEELEKYLSSSQKNFAVLTDYSAIEGYKSNNVIATLYDSMFIVSKFPQQVIVLKGTIDCCGIFAKPPLVPEIFIDFDQTIHFRNFFPDIKAAKAGDEFISKQINANGVAAKDQIKRMLRDSKLLLAGLAEVAKTYSKNELQVIRSKEWLVNNDIKNKVIRYSMIAAESMFSRHPNVSRLPQFEELYHSFIFRQALCAQVLCLIWISLGRQNNIKLEKILNDQVDINFAAYALCFDGVLTKDQKLNLIYEYSKMLLDHFRTNETIFQAEYG